MLTLNGVNSGGLRTSGQLGSGPGSATSLIDTLAAVSSSIPGRCLIRSACLWDVSHMRGSTKENCVVKWFQKCCHKSPFRRFTSSASLLNKFCRKEPHSVSFHPPFPTIFSHGNFLHLSFFKKWHFVKHWGKARREDLYRWGFLSQEIRVKLVIISWVSKWQVLDICFFILFL